MYTPRFPKSVKENIKPRGVLVREINSLNNDWREASSSNESQITSILKFRDQVKQISKEELKKQLDDRFYRLTKADIVFEDDKMEM
ncbi:unnamed protein product [Meloidogyne enterolobii]|uniref:Uncharacterized protein n=1 Tax=Meloidogyne enterolobii TaxID=390850 RepID=A0ACB1A1F8_MELEN